ncbi:MarR family winged helix-turn-helix transcriptional regulator [Thermoflexibacter ruber]|uniref:HTH marR-type domain-containing protein n=1 Tax=Thermoflexibacter ruber TaxID=1003 RepID=A0A1I2HH42_9BACT|nr:hypothetical protein [Thermoflexibacter ruber]SFF29595.1 hypothetical protein SAMN04488541_102432 [Thermoflexibacter ruber]
MTLRNSKLNVLRILRGAYPTSISTADIREQMLDKNRDALRLVDWLCAKSLVAKKICTEDRRLVNVLISEEGQELLRKIDEKMEELDKILQVISIEEAQKLNEILDKIENISGLSTK